MTNGPTTFLIVLLLGFGFLLIVSAIENTPLSATIASVLAGSLTIGQGGA